MKNDKREFEKEESGGSIEKNIESNIPDRRDLGKSSEYADDHKEKASIIPELLAKVANEDNKDSMIQISRIMGSVGISGFHNPLAEKLLRSILKKSLKTTKNEVFGKMLIKRMRVNIISG